MVSASPVIGVSVLENVLVPHGQDLRHGWVDGVQVSFDVSLGVHERCVPGLRQNGDLLSVWKGLLLRLFFGFVWVAQNEVHCTDEEEEKVTSADVEREHCRLPMAFFTLSR